MNNEIHQKTIHYIYIPQGDIDIETNSNNDSIEIIEDERRPRLYIPDSLNFLYIKDENESPRIKKQSLTPEFMFSANTYDTDRNLELPHDDYIDWLYKAEKEVFRC
jgi:hypothetical protein